MMIRLLLAALALTPVQQSSETPSPMLERWERIGGDETGTVSIDPQTITRNGSRVRVYVRLELKSDAGEELGVMRYVYDCRARTARLEQLDTFYPSGRLMDSMPVDAEDQEDEPIGRDTPNEAVLQRVCR
jgi:hypothetical protein